MKKSKPRRFLVTIEEVEPEVDPLDIEHQEPAPLHRRGGWWLTALQKRERDIAARRERARAREKEQAGHADADS